MKFKNSVFTSRDFNRSLEKISQSPLKRASAIYRSVKLLKAVKVEAESFEAARMKLVDEYCEKNEKGERILASARTGEIKLKPDTSKEFHKQFADLQETEFEVHVMPCTIEDLEGCEVTPADVLALEGFIVLPEE